MKIAVCVKLTSGEAGPFDTAALESAVEALGERGGELTLLSMGPRSCAEPLGALARRAGCSARAVLLSDPVFAGSDTLATVRTLAAALRRLEPDVVFCGRQSVDSDTGQVGPALAERLGFSLVPYALGFALPKCPTRNGETALELPAVLTIERVKTFRFPSLRSKRVEPEIWTNAELGLDESLCGLLGSPTRVLSSEPMAPVRRNCRFISREELLPLIERLGRETQAAKPSVVPSAGREKLRVGWAVGKRVEPEASVLAETAVLIEPDEADSDAFLRRIESERPDAILWSSDDRGRTRAPRVAARLELGLCADCTALTVERGRLIMTRPACRGERLARIESRTVPAMATVRTIDPEAGRIIVAAGRGVADELERIERLAERLGAEWRVSRPLVDAFRAPAFRQVGLTGGCVAPSVYIAVGISGALEHRVGMERSGRIIAVNPDRAAPIFDFADYGLIEKF